jgi:hypothetical protein
MRAGQPRLSLFPLSPRSLPSMYDHQRVFKRTVCWLGQRRGSWAFVGDEVGWRGGP